MARARAPAGTGGRHESKTVHQQASPCADTPNQELVLSASMPPVTDIHTHIVPAHFPRFADGRESPIGICPGCTQGRADVIVDGKPFRTITDECWNVARRLDTMQRTGIGFQLLSPMPELLSYWRPADIAADLARHVNDSMAEMVRQSPSHFKALGMVPLQAPDLAIEMLHALMACPEFCGVEIGTNINGLPLGDPQFEAFFAAAEQLGAAIFIHPLRPVPGYRTGGPGLMNALAVFPCEIALAAVSLFTSGVLTRHRQLRLAFSHGGGALSLILPRLDHGWDTLPAARQAIAERPSTQARRLYYDSLVYDRDALAFLVAKLGRTQICIGTDQPFAVAEQDPLGRIDGLGLPAPDRARLLRENAARFAGL